MPVTDSHLMRYKPLRGHDWACTCDQLTRLLQWQFETGGSCDCNPSLGLWVQGQGSSLL